MLLQADVFRSSWAEAHIEEVKLKLFRSGASSYLWLTKFVK